MWWMRCDARLSFNGADEVAHHHSTPEAVASHPRAHCQHSRDTETYSANSTSFGTSGSISVSPVSSPAPAAA
jgi:hypothetical protein